MTPASFQPTLRGFQLLMDIHGREFEISGKIYICVPQENEERMLVSILRSEWIESGAKHGDKIKYSGREYFVITKKNMEYGLEAHQISTEDEHDPIVRFLAVKVL